MHPDRNDIRGLLLGRLAGEKKAAIESHLESCEFCRELAEEYRLQAEALKETADRPVPEKAHRLRERLAKQAFPPSVIDLKELMVETLSRGHLAADGGQKAPARWQHLKTLFSETPEVVLRVMRDAEQSKEYLQVIAEDSSLYAHVLVKVPSLDVSVVTNHDGYADIPPGVVERLSEVEWQIQLPDAVFALEPLEYDPDKTESRKEIILSTDNDDKIRVVYESKTGGRQLTIEILELEGSSDFGDVNVIMTADDSVDIWKAAPRVGRAVSLSEPTGKIFLRLFH